MTYLRVGVAACALATLVAKAAPALAVGETITDVKIKDNNRTSEDTIRAMAGTDIGDDLEVDTLEMIRERLNNSGMFADVDVFWEPYKGGARVVITVREKFPWAPVPTLSLSPGNKSFGAVVVHGNLFGRGKQGVLGGRISNVNSGALLAYRDPATFGTWIYWEAQAAFKDLEIPEFGPRASFGNIALRTNSIRSYGLSTRLGVFWWRRVRTEIGWDFARWNYLSHKYYMGDAIKGLAGIGDPGPGSDSATVGDGIVGLKFDYRVREHAIQTGNALNIGLRLGNPTWGSDSKIDYWKLGIDYFHGLRFMRRINWTNSAGFETGERAPLWSEAWSGGSNLRGYDYMRFRGDTRVYYGSEFHFPIISLGSLDIRGLGFYDVHSVWWRHKDDSRIAKDGRNFLTDEYQPKGFKLTRDIHNGVGGGLRFFLRSIAVPLVGLDYGYGVEDRSWRFVLIIGA
jgi:outer membrane protein assembly factor BamA